MSSYIEQLEFTQKSTEWVEPFYRAAFPDYKQQWPMLNDKFLQTSGVDRLIVLEDKKILKIEEKIRTVWYAGDLLFETVSCCELKTPGWAEKDLVCDYFVYVCPSQRVGNVFWWPSLKAAWEQNKPWWNDKTPRFGETHGVDGSVLYHTRNIPVTYTELSEAGLTWTGVSW